MRKCAQFSFKFFILWRAFNGILRYLLLKIKLPFYLIYVDKILLLICILFYVIYLFIKQKINITILIVITLIFLSILVSIFYVTQKFQILFGLWVVLPFIYGVIFFDYINFFQIKRYLLFVFIFSVLGVIITALFKVPWVGFSYSVGNVVLEGSRKWYTMGLLRAPGFGRISSETSAIILILSLILVYIIKNKFINFFIWLISGISIFLTTTKTTIVIWLFFSFIFIINSLFKRINGSLYIKLLIAISFFIGLILPWISYYYENLELTATDAPILLSFRERIQSMWPYTIKIIFNYGNPFFGRGIGGLGAPAFYFENNIYTPADNLMLYIYGLFGILGVIFVLLFVVYLFSKKIEIHDELYLVLLSIVLIYGITINSLENSFLSLTFGLSLSFLFKRKNCYTNSYLYQK